MSASRWLLIGLLAAPAAAGAQAPPAGTPPPVPVWPANRPSSATVTADTKVDIGTVRTLDAAHGAMICDMPDGQVTYDVTQIQVYDDSGKPLGAASALHPGDRVRVFYTIGTGAKVKEVWVLPPGQ